jgi:hypothetical protein
MNSGEHIPLSISEASQFFSMIILNTFVSDKQLQATVSRKHFRKK